MPCFNIFFFFRLNEAGEIIIKTKSDYWVIAKLSNLREFYIVVQLKNVTIIDIDGVYEFYFILITINYNLYKFNYFNCR